MAITRDQLKKINVEVLAALEPVAKKHGFTLTVEGGTFANDFYTPRVRFGSPEGAADSFAVYATMYGLAPTDYGREFTDRGTRYRIDGVNLGSRKLPIRAIRVGDNTPFKFPVAIVKEALR